MRDGPGRYSGGVSVYVSDRLHARVELVKTAEDASYLWLKLKCVVQDCPEVYFCVCYMPALSASQVLHSHTHIKKSDAQKA